MVRPCVARRFVELAAAVLHQCIRPLIGACAPGHHVYQRACDLISRQASIGPFGSPSVRMRREDRSSISTYPLADLGWKRLIGLRHRLLLISRNSFVRAEGRSFVPARRTSIASRPSHGARIKRVGRLHRRSSSVRRRVLSPTPPGQACWRARSPARCGATASWRLRSRT